MARGVIRKIVGTSGIGAGLTAAGAAIGNVLGPRATADPGMSGVEEASYVANWHPHDVGTAALIGGAVGLGIGMYNRHQELKRHSALRKDQFDK